MKSILKLRVPVIVRIGERQMALDDVLALSPGAIVELPKPAERPLDLMVNNKVVGLGSAVKIGENFGIRVLEVGDASARVRAIAGQQAAADAARKADADADAPAEGEGEHEQTEDADAAAPEATRNADAKQEAAAESADPSP